MSRASLIFAALKHWKDAHWARRVHSPSLLTLMEQTYANRNVFQDVEQLRKKYLDDKRLLSGEDYGAGSKTGRSLRVSSLARHSLASSPRAAFYHGLAKAARVENILEMGTSLGITTVYLERALPPDGKLVSMEGNAGVAGMARETFRLLGASKVRLLEGTFAELISALPHGFDPTMVLLDGDHRYDSTLAYFDQLMMLRQPPRLIIIDDIRWTDGMEQAWRHIVNDVRCTLTVDFFRFGLVFTSSDFAKQHIKIRSML